MKIWTIEIILILMKGDIPRHNEFLRSRMETLVPFLSIGVANKDTLKSSRIKFTPVLTMNMDK